MIEIIYTARRRLKVGINSGDLVTLTVPLSAFDPDVTIDESTTTAIGGAPQISLKHFFDTWSIVTDYDSVNDQDDYEQFFYSILGGATFTITDYDHDDDVINVIMQGKWRKTPVRRFNRKEFTYSFKVRGESQ